MAAVKVSDAYELIKRDAAPACRCRNIWCRLDGVLHCKVKSVCDKHDRLILGEA